MKKTLKVALVQMTSVDSVQANIDQIQQALTQVTENVDLVCLPENSLFFRIRKEDSLQSVDLKEAFWSELQAWCAKSDAVIHVGGTPYFEGGHTFNASLWVTKNGVKAVYKKIHLFDVEVKGQSSLKESDYFKEGYQVKTKTLRSWHIGLSICYDLRFAELYNLYAQESVDLILVPSAFLQTTGKAHWHTLLKARAIESQAYVIAAAQSGQHTSTKDQSVRSTYGHSLVVDPWGEVLCDLNDQAGPKVQIVELDKARIQEVRQQIPMASHRRLWT